MPDKGRCRWCPPPRSATTKKGGASWCPPSTTIDDDKGRERCQSHPTQPLTKRGGPGSAHPLQRSTTRSTRGGEESAVPTSTTIVDTIEGRSQRCPRCTTIDMDKGKGGASGAHDARPAMTRGGGGGGMHDNRRQGEEVLAVPIMHDVDDEGRIYQCPPPRCSATTRGGCAGGAQRSTTTRGGGVGPHHRRRG